MRAIVLFCLLCSIGAALRAQTSCPDVTREGERLCAPAAKSYQWFRDGAEVPGATERCLTPPADGNYTVRVRSLDAAPTDYTPGPTVVVTGAVLDEFLRPIAGVEVSIAGVKAKSGADGRFYIYAPRAERLAARAMMTGYHAHTVGFMPTAADTQFVYLHLAKQVITHKLPGDKGGTISQGGFWLTLPPNAVVTADGKTYTGEIQLSVVARRPGDRDFAQRMPGGDFMAVDKGGASKVLYSYGFTGVEMTDADGKPLNMAPGQKATIEFLITEEQRPGAPDEMPLWHFDEVAGLWMESGTVRKEGLTYRAEVGHFSWWNCDVPYEMATIECTVITCNGSPAAGINIKANQMEATTDADGHFTGRVPATIEIGVTVVNTDTTLTPLAQNESRALGTFDAGWGAFQAVGMADTNHLLTVYAYGATDGVEYSLDGESWQSEPTFVLKDTIAPAYGWARNDSCDTQLRFRNHALVLFQTCITHAYLDLGKFPTISTLEGLYQSNEPYYSVRLTDKDINLLTPAAEYQRCVEDFIYEIRNQTPNTPEEVTAGVNRLCGLWPNLKSLFVQSCGLPEVPNEVTNLPLLEVLYLNNHQFTNVPETLINLRKLRRLSLDQNQLTSLPPAFVNLRSLELLSLSSNQFTEAPAWLAELPTLYDISFRDNHLTEFLLSLPKLSGLVLTNNQLTGVPETVREMTKLHYLWLAGNPLKSVPEWLGELKNLQILELDRTELSEVPASIGGCAFLNTLFLSNNHLTTLPDTYGNLTSLKSLILNSNQLTTLPASFAKLADTLKTLYLNDNPISPEEQARIRAMLPNTSITF